LRVIKNKNIQFEEFNNYLPILNGQIKKNGQFRVITKDDIWALSNTNVYPKYLDITAECADIDELIQATAGFMKKYLLNSEMGLFLYNEDKRTYCVVNQISEELNTFVGSVHKDALIEWLIETGKPKILPDPRSAKINGTSTNYLLYHSREDLKKKLVVFAIEKKGKGISRLYGKVIKQSSANELGAFMKANIETDTKIKTDSWSGYKPLKNDFVNLTHEPSGKKGENFPDLHRVIMGFKGWLRGMHHHTDHLQAYINVKFYFIFCVLIVSHPMTKKS